MKPPNDELRKLAESLGSQPGSVFVFPTTLPLSHLKYLEQAGFLWRPTPDGRLEPTDPWSEGQAFVLCDRETEWLVVGIHGGKAEMLPVDGKAQEEARRDEDMGDMDEGMGDMADGTLDQYLALKREKQKYAETRRMHREAEQAALGCAAIGGVLNTGMAEPQPQKPRPALHDELARLASLVNDALPIVLEQHLTSLAPVLPCGFLNEVAPSGGGTSSPSEDSEFVERLRLISSKLERMVVSISKTTENLQL